MEYSNPRVKLIRHFFVKPFLLRAGVGIKGPGARRGVQVD